MPDGNRSYISTYHKKRFDPYKARASDIVVEDIAHSLSMMCRANGHFGIFYSVGQHCLYCALEAQARGHGREIMLACLLHDASEAYLGDITRPVKRRLTGYLKIEAQLQALIERTLGLEPLSADAREQVRRIDDCLLCYEFEKYNGDILPYDKGLLHIALPDVELPHAEVKRRFIELYHSLR